MSASDFCFSVGVREMKILLTNDDSIQAKGLAVLWSELIKIAEVVVVAPDRERSATGHGITMDIPLHLLWSFNSS